MFGYAIILASIITFLIIENGIKKVKLKNGENRNKKKWAKK